MTVAEIKNRPDYIFDCEIKLHLDEINDNYESWGMGLVWFKDDESIGAEYNLCLEDGENYSAIYRSVITEDGYLSADYDDYIPYKIDFTDKDWEVKFEDAMCEALIAFFHL